MSMVIAGVTLDHDMYWEDEFKGAYGTGVADRTIGGTMVIQQAPLVGARPMTLTGNENMGWQKRSTVLQLTELVKVRTYLATPFTVAINSVNYTCLFRFEGDESPVDFTITSPAWEPTADTWYYGTIKMRIIA